MPGAYPCIAAFATLLFWHIKGAEGGAPLDLVIPIDRVEHFIGETIDLLPIMQDVTGWSRQIVTNIGAKLNDGKFARGNPPDIQAKLEASHAKLQALLDKRRLELAREQDDARNPGGPQ